MNAFYKNGKLPLEIPFAQLVSLVLPCGAKKNKKNTTSEIIGKSDHP